MVYKYEDRLYANSVIHLISENRFIETGETKEIKEVYRKAKAFDEIVNEFHSQLQNLESWDTLDQKDCQTLKQIVGENIEEGE